MCKDKSSMDIPVEADAATAQGWQALCNGHIGGWYGPCRTSSADARSDAAAHDRDSHGGDRWAVVVRRSCSAADVPESKIGFVSDDADSAVAAPAVAGRIYVTIEVRCPKCNCYLASFSEYRESSSSIYVGAIITISYSGVCYNKGECGSGAFDWRGTVTRGKVISIR